MNLVFQIGHSMVKIPSNTKNHAVKNVPIASKTVAKEGNIVGFIGETYLPKVDSILISYNLEEK